MASRDETLRFRLKDDTRVVVRPLQGGDEAALLAFFRKVPLEDRLFMEDDITDPEVIRRWCGDIDPEKAYPLVAVDGSGNIVADGVLRMRKTGWQRHIGEILVTVDRAFQHKGLGSILTRQLHDMVVMEIDADVLWEQMMELEFGDLSGVY